MNHVHRSLWNDQTGTFVAVSENTRSGGKKISSGASAAGGGISSFPLKTLAVSLMLACGAGLHAQPVGGVVSAGSATIGGPPGSMVINQATPNAVINWQSFGIQAGESVQFVQPGTSSVMLNRVVGANPSSILGSLTSNGKVFLVNPNGILFGLGATVNVGGLVASTLNISDANFLAGNYTFSGTGSGTLVNNGQITAANGGYVAMLGANVSNQGVIAAQLGTVALAAGDAVTLDIAGDKLLNVAVGQGAVNALVENGGMIRADGGQVLMTTQAAGSLLANAVNNTGLVQAQTLVTGKNGSIKLLGGMENGSVNVGGTLDASAPGGGHGGFIETSAARVKVADNTRVTTLAPLGITGTWLIDPTDFTIGAAGDITGSSLGTNLATSNVTFLSSNGLAGVDGDIHVNEAVTWTAPTTLTLDAVRDVNVNGAIVATNGSLVARAGRNVNTDAAISLTTGNLTLEAVNNVTVKGAVTIITGDLTAVAGGSIYIDKAMTVTTGNMVLRADNDGSGPGAAAGTVAIFCGNSCLTITNGTLDIRFNPDTYANTSSEILAYGAKLTGGGTLQAKAWVFAEGENRVYDGTTAATLAFKDNPNAAAGSNIFLKGGSAVFNDKNVGNAKPINYAGYTVDGTNKGSFDLFGGGAGTTQANITPLVITGSITAASKVYDGNNLASLTSRTLAGQIVGDTVSYTGGTATFSDKNVANGKTVTGVGLSLGGADAGNYSVNPSATTTANITPAPLTVTANDQTKQYGQNFAFNGTEFTSSGLQPADTIASVTLTSAGTPPTAHVAGSPYPITPSAATGGSFSPSNYTITYVNGAMVVTPAPLTVTANDQTKAYGTAFGFNGTEFTSSGLLNTDTIGSATLVSAGTPATAPVVGSPYPITPSAATGGTFLASDYVINYVNGVMTVTPLPLTITAANVSKSYGDTPALSAFSTSALANGETVGSVTQTSPGTAATASVAGSPYVITPSSANGGTFTPTNYTISYVNGILTVIPAPLTVTANDASKVAGQTATLPTSAFTPVGLKNGETIGSVTETSPGTVASANAGLYPITPTGATGGTFTPGNYAITYKDGQLVVTPLVTPPVVTPPVVTPPVVTPPVVAPPVVAPPVTGTPDAGPFPFPAIQPVPPAAIVPAPVPTSVVPVPVALVLVPPPAMPPTFVRVVEPVEPPPVITPPEAPLTAPVTAPIAAPASMTPPLYVAPHRARKQDRN